MLLVLALAATMIPTAAFAAPEAAPAQSGGFHIVRKGETLSQIARYYGVTVNALKAANGLSDANYVYVGQRLHIPGSSGAPAGCASYYYVRPGDNLSRIAARFGMNTYALASSNGISNASYIYVGQHICIPNIYGGPSYYPHDGHDQHGDGGHDHHGDGGYGRYVVKAGDTLSEIAKGHGTSVRHLMQINGIHDPNYIYIGQVLRLG
ncbi:MAG: LysM peptidoglycan-binding domain-containing protein [Caldilineaceae bacterium]